MAGVRAIVIGRTVQYATTVSAQDYDYLMQWRWTFAVSHPRGALVYARRSMRNGAGRNVTVLMHRVILTECMGVARPPAHFTDHRDGYSLNNTRENLCWVTAIENMKNQRGIVAEPLPDDPIERMRVIAALEGGTIAPAALAADRIERSLAEIPF